MAGFPWTVTKLAAPYISSPFSRGVSPSSPGTCHFPPVRHEAFLLCPQIVLGSETLVVPPEIRVIPGRFDGCSLETHQKSARGSTRRRNPRTRTHRSQRR